MQFLESPIKTRSYDILIELGPIGVLLFWRHWMAFFGTHTGLEKSDNKTI